MFSLHSCNLAIDTWEGPPPWDGQIGGVFWTPQLLPAWWFSDTAGTENTKIRIKWSWLEEQLTWPSGNCSLSPSSSSLLLGPRFFFIFLQWVFLLEDSYWFCWVFSCSSSSSFFRTSLILATSSGPVSSLACSSSFPFFVGFLLNWRIKFPDWR